MPAAYHISEDDGLITIRVERDTELPELFELAARLLDDSAYHSAIPLLVDLRTMNLSEDTSTLPAFNRFMVQNFGQTRRACIAVVIDNDLDRRVCAGVYRLTCAITGCEMFEDYDHAIKWLIRKEFVPASSQA